MFSTAILLVVAVSLVAGDAPNPEWPEQFTSMFHVLIEKFGKDWSSTGFIYYDWKIKAFRSDFVDWCLPLFDSGPNDRNNFSCSYVAIDHNMYFVNRTSETWEKNECCLFEKNLGAVPPNWMTFGTNNGTETVNDELCNLSWFPGKQCIAYWSSVKTGIPVRFFGISSLGYTILNYSSFMPGVLPPGMDISKPNAECDVECEPSMIRRSNASKEETHGQSYVSDWPSKWPTCD